MKPEQDIAAARLGAAQLAANFADAAPPLTPAQALTEASRCYFCHDAPCVTACPTGIDIPSFIRKIATGNLRGSAKTILEENILGGSCARVCPTEILCQQSCVRMAEEERPLRIGALQRHATDWLMQHDPAPFTRAVATGRRISVVGAGPAGLACAHRLARYGHDVIIFEAKPRAGGLNEYGIAAYKLVDDFAQAEIDFILSIGGISIRHGMRLGQDLDLAALRAEFDAVFLGLGQAGVRALGLPDETLPGVRDAVDFIAELRQAADKSAIAVGRRVVVIGGGNTAIDAATQAKRLGAEEVTLVYRRGAAQMSATGHEQEWAKSNGVLIRYFATPVQFVNQAGALAGVVFRRTTAAENGSIGLAEDSFTLPADMVLKAVGQAFVPTPVLGGSGALALDGGRIVVDAERRSSLPDVFAGGDCIPGTDLTVAAVQDGKLAAEAINRQLLPAKEA